VEKMKKRTRRRRMNEEDEKQEDFLKPSVIYSEKIKSKELDVF
jgi:hypothetical protein